MRAPSALYPRSHRREPCAQRAGPRAAPIARAAAPRQAEDELARRDDLGIVTHAVLERLHGRLGGRACALEHARVVVPKVHVVCHERRRRSAGRSRARGEGLQCAKGGCCHGRKGAQPMMKRKSDASTSAA
eukprot:6500027-Prymnesium_polylepis.1